MSGEWTLYQEGTAPVELNEGNQKQFKDALGKAINDNREHSVNPIDPGFGIDPIDPGFGIDPILGEDGIPTPILEPGERLKFSTDVKVSAFNKAMENNGSNSFIQKDPMSGEWTLYQEGTAPVELNEGNQKQFKDALGKAINDNREHSVNPIDPGFGIDPIDVIVKPVPDATNDQKAAAFNSFMARQGKDAEIYENANGDYIITFKDGQGNEHARQLTESEVNERKANIANQIKSKLPNVSPIDPGFGIDPIEVVLPPAEPAPEVPTRGQWVAEKKAEIKEKLGNKLPTPPTGGLPPVVGAPDWIAEKKAEIRDKFASNIPTEPRHDNGDTAKERMAEFKNQGSAKLAARIEEAKNSNQKDTNPVIPAPEFNFNDQYQDMLTAEIEELDTKMDSVMASTHAINNARPFLSGAGKTSIGLGMGYAGDEGAVAVGIAHAFTESWSASMTMNVTTGDHSEVSSGAGVQFQF